LGWPRLGPKFKIKAYSFKGYFPKRGKFWVKAGPLKKFFGGIFPKTPFKKKLSLIGGGFAKFFWDDSAKIPGGAPPGVLQDFLKNLGGGPLSL